MFLGINAGEVAQMQSGGECDGFRALAAVSPSCLATVVKSHRTWILMLRHLNPPSNGASVPAQASRTCAPPKFSIKAVHATARGSLLVSRRLSYI